MAAPKRFLIPSLSEMENVDIELEKDKGSLFKRHKSSNDFSNDEGSAISNSNTITNRTRNEKGSDSIGLSSVVGISASNDDKAIPTTKTSSTDSNKAVVGPSTSLESDKPSVNSSEISDNFKSSTVSKPGSSNSLIVNPRQRGNPILKCVRNVPWEYGNIVADYVMGPTNCALYLSLRYHQLHPNYIHDRLKNIGRSFELRVMLVQVDVKEPHHLLKDLAKICLLADCTLILAFSPEEAGRYLETYKVFENKPAEAIMERTEDNYMAKCVDCLTRVKSVNKTDCATLLTAFGSLSNIMEAKEDELCLCPGFGPQKAKRIRDIFQEPFLRSQSKGKE